MKALFLTLALLASAGSAHAYKGEVTFTEEEKARHAEGLPVIMTTAAACLKADIDYHQSFYKKWGISPFYGDRSSFARVMIAEKTYRSTTVEEKKQYLRSYRKFSEAQIDQYLKIMRPTSCVGLVLRCLGKGFEQAGQQDLWQKLKAFTMANDVEGGALQEGLQNLGWVLMYWNPDTTQNAYFDRDDQRRTPDNKDYIWGKHAYNWQAVQTRRKYLYNKVDDITSLVNFGKQVPQVLRDLPFFVGVAHMGYHVFPGTFGQIIEGHSARKLDDYQTIESSPFNPLVDGGGPRGFYRSGLIAVPPGYEKYRGEEEQIRNVEELERRERPKVRRKDPAYSGPQLFNWW